MTLYRKKLIYNVLFWINAILLVTNIIVLIILGSLDIIKDPMYIVAFIIPISIFSILAAVNFLFSYIVVHTLNSLKRQNSYHIHRPNHLFNLDLFIKEIIAKRRFINKYDGYLISISPLSKSSYAFTASQSMVSDYFGYFSDFITAYITNECKLKSKEALYCYDEGTFYLYVARDKQYVENLIQDIEEALYQIAKDNNIRIFINPTFGVCRKNENYTIYQLINCADHAKKIAEENFEMTVFYDENTMTTKNDFTAEEFIDAFNNKEFVVYYQPKFHLQSHTFVSTEALIRWNSPKHGLIGPGKFINAMEEFGLIHALDMYVFEAVCDDMVEAKRRGHRLLPCSINFSLYEFYAPGFVNDIVETITKLKINPALIELEVTESTTSANNFLAISILKQLKDFGIRILMDDFGKGYSNLMNIKKMPVDIVKIDKSFIDDIVIDGRSREVVRLLINFCKANNIEVVAEGVDDQRHVDILTLYKCDIIQGFYYSKPIPKNELRKFLATNTFEKKGVTQL